jgi:hypothetical protein
MDISFFDIHSGQRLGRLKMQKIHFIESLFLRGAWSNEWVAKGGSLLLAHMKIRFISPG